MQAHQRALQPRFGQPEFPVVHFGAVRQQRLGALLRALGAGSVDLVGPFKGGGYKAHPAAGHAEKAAHAGRAAHPSDATGA